MYSLRFHLFAIILALAGLILAAPDVLDIVNNTKSSRSADTCADPSLVQTVFQSFRADTTVHVLNYRGAYENANTQAKAIVWGDLHPAFRAWPTQQSFTVPLFQLRNADATQYIYRIGTNAQTPPVVSGFVADVGVIAWVYNSQVCGSVPLMSATLAAFTDSYVTISAFEHDGLITDGWTDTGVVAYVLPLYYS